MPTDRELAADTIARFVLIRRLFAEFAALRGSEWLREQEELAQADLRAVRTTQGELHPETMEIASGIITQMLSGLITKRPD